MINIFENPPKNNWFDITERPTKTVDNIESIVFDIFNSVKSNGDNAIKQLNQKYYKHQYPLFLILYLVDDD